MSLYAFRQRRSRGKGGAGFSLLEVVIALAVVALAVPVMFGLFSFFSQTSANAVNHEEAARAFTAVSLYLNGNSLDADTKIPLGGSSTSNTPGAYFTTVLNWVQGGTQVLLFVYKSSDPTTASQYQVSQTPPGTGTWTGTLLIAQITSLYMDKKNTVPFLPSATMSATPYTKGYIPVEVALYARPSGSMPAGAAPSANSLIDTYPAVVLR